MVLKVYENNIRYWQIKALLHISIGLSGFLGSNCVSMFYATKRYFGNIVKGMENENDFLSLDKKRLMT
jgi:hypothetical protein